jgi:pyruvate/2-oxoglutarate dehydrogenase complex dihydrolipoamide acyltransferase (E2) component
MSAADRIETLDYAERWFRDGLRAIDPPGCLVAVEADMSQAVAFRHQMQERGTPVTYNTLVVHAAAAALAQHPKLHKLMAGNHRIYPGTVDICLSVAGDAAVTPVLIIKDAANKSWSQLGAEIRDRAAVVRREDEKRLALLRRWGWVVPFAVLRKALIRYLLSRAWYRRMASGTFQVSVVSSVDVCVPFLFNTAGVLSAGRVQDRVVALDGRAQIRPMLTLTCCVDHKIWNGMDAAEFLGSVKSCLEQVAA